MTKSRKRISYATFLAVTSLFWMVSTQAVKAQNWDDVGFWTADFALNTLQRQAAAEKLEEYRKTYVILRDGYKIVRGLVSDNHKLHEVFFEELASVNSVVRDYHKVKDIGQIYIREARNLSRDAPQLLRLLRSTEAFSESELEQIEQVFDGMLDRIVSSVEELGLIVLDTSDGLEMMDSERIVIVDRLYEESVEITSSIRQFRMLLLNLASQRTDTSVNSLENLFSVRP